MPSAAAPDATIINGVADSANSAAVIEEKELVRFERADEYLSLLSQLVPSSSNASTSAVPVGAPASHNDTLGSLISILDEYQDQSSLLDPYLERIVSPPVEALQRHVRSLVGVSSSSSSLLLDTKGVTSLSKLVYAYTKVRGYKTIVHYFPHEVADLPATLSFLEDLQRLPEGQGCWELRYTCLLWLSLICMIPFDLAKFDRTDGKDTTASRIANVAGHFIESPGKERDAAAVVLGRLFQRSDVQNGAYFSALLDSSLTALKSKELSPFHATGILQALCEILKTSEPAFVAKHLAAFQSIVEAYDSLAHVSLNNNGLIVKYRTKLSSRLALKLLRPRARRHANKFHVLGSTDATPTSNAKEDEEDDDESDIPDEVESSISTLLESLQHKDTVVRYSAAKGLARLCDRLPNSFLTQVVDAIVSLFHINIPDLYNGANDLSSVSEHTWQGACMALAELSRRGLLFKDMLGEALPWILKALLFDVRRGAHSVGANVRDAACYVVWALARSNDVESIRPHAMDLAKRLVAVATLDRDVSIRRAASAAFQESVGRLALFPHGIDVIRMTDFYAVSVRRTAFLKCAVKVAQFEEYRSYLLEHLTEVVGVHWDSAMRRLGSQAVARITMHDPAALMPETIAKLGQRMATTDVAILQGTLLSLAEIARLSRALPQEQAAVGEKTRASAFELLASVRPMMLRTPGAAALLAATCDLIGSAFPSDLKSTVGETDTWEKILNLALSRQEEFVHTAAAEAVAKLSTAVDLSAKLRSTLDGWTSLTLPQQQSNAVLLGAVDYARHMALFEPIVEHLIALGRPSSKAHLNHMYSANIEVRRNAVDSLTRATLGLGDKVLVVCKPAILQSLVRAYMVGLEDYSSDQRGDVGSWVRLSSLAGLQQVLIMLSTQHGGTKAWLSEENFHDAIGGMWKQAAERIDHVRHAAGTSVLAVYRAYERLDGLKPVGYDLVRATYGDAPLEPETNKKFRDSAVAFPALIHLLTLALYRTPILEGLLLSVGSKSDLGERIIAPSLASLTMTCSYSFKSLLTDIFNLAKTHFGDNRIFVPSLVLVSLLLETGAYEQGVESILSRVVKMAMTNVTKVKSVPRVSAAAVLAANLVLPISMAKREGEGPVMLIAALESAVEVFLKHGFPTVRTKMAEQLYAVLSSSVDFDEEEEEEEGGKVQKWEELEAVLLDTKWGATGVVDDVTIKSITDAVTLILS